MSWLSKTLVRVTDAAICFGQKTWRPLMGWSAALAVTINGVVIPVWNKEIVDLSQLALLVTACAPLFAVRGYEKFKTAKLEGEE
jgi:hypothetical protein